MEALLWSLLDLVLASLALGLAWAAISSPDLKRGVVLFIAFGLLLALIWARLRAPDLALAEAAIGAGLSGALMLAALRDEPGSAGGLISGPFAWLVSLASLIVACGFGWALLAALSTADSSRLAGLVGAQLARSGVQNPVTAVLLNFRAYDTFLELAVLLTAVLGILALGPARPVYRAAGPVLGSLVNWLLPLLVVTAGYLLWVGAHAPGGAFQAGALLASAAVLLRLSGRANAGLPGPIAQRVFLVGGLAAFLVISLALIAGGGAFLEYPQTWAGPLILLIETAATIAIATTLALAYLGGRPKGWEPREASAPTCSDRKESS